MEFTLNDKKRNSKLRLLQIDCGLCCTITSSIYMLVIGEISANIMVHECHCSVFTGTTVICWCTVRTLSV